MDKNYVDTALFVGKISHCWNFVNTAISQKGFTAILEYGYNYTTKRV